LNIGINLLFFVKLLLQKKNTNDNRFKIVADNHSQILKLLNAQFTLNYISFVFKMKIVNDNFNDKSLNYELND